MLIKDVLTTTGITATAGIGTNLYLAKIAMDIKAKKMPADEDGVRIAELDEMSYRKELWEHRPLTDFWRVGKGYARSLEANGMFTMGDVARCSIGGMFERRNEALLYKLFGVNAELLIDHAWGYEPCTIAEIKAYKPETKSLNSGQVLHCPYDAEKAKLVIREMADLLSLDIVEKGLVTNQIVLTIGYDIENLTDPKRSALYWGEVTTDHYGRKIPKHSQGTENFKYTSSTKRIVQAVSDLYDRIVNPNLLIRRMYISVNNLVMEGDVKDTAASEQLSFFVDYEKLERERVEESAALEKEKQMQTTIIDIKRKYGKNAILKGMNLEEGATAKDRNAQIGGHKA
jgi:DNA polymerase V